MSSNAPPEHDPLTPDLSLWRVSPRRDPNFRLAVWSRIRRAERSPGWTAFARAHAGAVAALIVAGLVAGAWTGRAEARERIEADRSAVAANYVHSLDARWMRHP